MTRRGSGGHVKRHDKFCPTFTFDPDRLDALKASAALAPGKDDIFITSRP